MHALRGLTLLPLSFALASVVRADTAPPEPGEYYHLSLEELMAVEIDVGTRGPERALSQSPVPVTVLTAAELERSGYGELNKVLQRLLPSFNFPRSTIEDGTDHARPFTLRGMGSDQVLVLINGKRRHSGALVHINDSVGRGCTSVDLNTIPLRAIERIEVLRDGAAAQYGSDAIAGIINIVLRADGETHSSATWGATREGDGEVLQVDYGFGRALPNEGFVHVTGEIRDRERTNRAGADSRQQYFDGDPRNDEPRLNDLVTFRLGDPEAQDRLAMLNGELPLSDLATCYFFGGASYRQSEAGGFFRTPQDDRNVRAIYPRGFLPLIAPEIWDLSAALGLRGETESAWSWDLSNSSGENRYQYHVENSLNASFGESSSTSFDCGTMIFRQSTTNVDLFRAFDDLLATPLRVGLGLEHRYEGYRIERGEEVSYIHRGVPVLDGPNAGAITSAGAQVFPGFMPGNERDESRHNIGLYLDLESDLRGELLLGLAGRYEYYDDFGSTLDGKLALAYQPLDAVVLRGSTSSGFRAPSLAQSHFTSTATAFIENVPYEVGTFPVDHPLAQGLGASDLMPERSLHVSAGATYQPLANVELAADYFLAAIENRIVLSGDINQDAEVYGQDVVDLLESYSVAGARYFTNAVDTRTQGADLSARLDWNLGAGGRLDLSAKCHLNRTRIIGDVKAPAVLGEAGEDVVLNRVERVRIEEYQPGETVILDATYQRGPIGCVVRGIRFGSIQGVIDIGDPASDPTFGAKWLTDVDLSYQLTDAVRVAFTGHNVFDVYPDFAIDQGHPFAGEGKIFQYPRASPFGFNGAFYAFRLDLRF